MFLVCCVTIGILGVLMKTEKMSKNIDDFFDLKKIVRSTTNSETEAFLRTSQIVLEKWKTEFLRFLYRYISNVHHIDRRTVVVSYAINGKTYKILVKSFNGPHIVQKVMDESGTDVGHEIFPFLGPNCDWHFHEFTPKFWGKKSLQFHMLDGNVKNFQENEKIIL
jgi:hypothetical protein